jgi:hypothetical protein
MKPLKKSPKKTEQQSDSAKKHNPKSAKTIIGLIFFQKVALIVHDQEFT